MGNIVTKRNGYIDIIKFLLAVIVAEFHLGSGIFPGGRLAVDGFFMITGYLMMRSIASSGEEEKIGVSTAKFLFRKYKALLPFLFVSSIIGFVVNCVMGELTLGESLKILPLLIFDIFPLLATGMQGVYVLGISWYLSSMFIALAVLFPLVKKFKTNFSLIACPLIALLFYGILSAKFGHIAVGSTLIEDTLIHTGWFRALAGCSLGCVIYEITKKTKNIELTKFAKIIFTILEFLALIFIFYMMHDFPKGRHNYVVVFVIFGMLIIGIGGLSYTSKLWNPKWTKYFGTASTLLVLNHFCWARLLIKKFNHLNKTETVLIYIGIIVAACVTTYLISKLLTFLTKKFLQKSLWIKDTGTN